MCKIYIDRFSTVDIPSPYFCEITFHKKVKMFLDRSETEDLIYNRLNLGGCVVGVWHGSLLSAVSGALYN